MNLPIPEYGKSIQETVDNLMDTVIKLRKELNYVVNHMDAESIVAGVITSQNGVSWLNLDSGLFSFGDGAISWNGYALTISGGLTEDDVTTIIGGTVTTNYINALDITAANIQADSIIADIMIESSKFCTNPENYYPRIDIGYYGLGAILIEADSADYGSIAVTTSGIMQIDATDEVRVYPDYFTRYDYNGVFSQVPACNSGQTIKLQTSSGRLEHSTNGGTFVVLANYSDISDVNEKQDLSYLTNDAVLDAVDEIDFVQFRYNSEVAEKGNKAKRHFGVVSQDVRAKFAEKGLNPDDFQIFTTHESPELPSFDPKGESKPPKKKPPEPSDKQAIVYTELHSLQMAALKRKITDLENRIIELEAQHG